MTILYIVSECVFSLALLLMYRKDKNFYAYGLAIMLLIDMVIKVINSIVLLPTAVKAVSSGLVLIAFFIFLIRWAKAAADTESDTDNIRLNKFKK